VYRFAVMPKRSLCETLRHPDNLCPFAISVVAGTTARLTSEQAGWMLICPPHDIPALVNARLLKPLGTPAHNGAKFSATADVLELTKDRS